MDFGAGLCALLAPLQDDEGSDRDQQVEGEPQQLLAELGGLTGVAHTLLECLSARRGDRDEDRGHQC